MKTKKSGSSEDGGKAPSPTTSFLKIISISVYIIAFVALIITLYSIFSGGKVVDPLNALLTTITLYFASASFSILYSKYERGFEIKMDYSEKLRHAILPEEKSRNEFNALEIMVINLENIKEFYIWSQKQARASFSLAICMCVFGAVLMITAIVLPLAYNLSLEMSIIPVVGGIITELVAGTALVVYRTSLSQLNHYHKALHEDERFLSGVNLVNSFKSEELHDEMLKELIKSEIQMNAALNKPELTKEKSKKLGFYERP
jgi:hypothetical protein